MNDISSVNNFPRNVNVIYSNLQGMLEGCHFEEFRNELNKAKNVHFIAIVETWLRSGLNANKMARFRSVTKRPKKNRWRSNVHKTEH